MAYNRKSPPSNRLYKEEKEDFSVQTPVELFCQNQTSVDNTSTRMTSSASVIDQIWTDIIVVDSVGAVEQGTKSMQSQLQAGWTTDQASQRREQDGSFNVVKPPIDCPNWLCILLPCINHLASMKAFKAIQPDDAEVLRNSKWIRYDAASLVTGDVIRLEEGDLVPADCVVISVEDDDDLLVDLAAVTGHDRPKSISNSAATRSKRQLYMGGRVVQGRATAMVTAVGPQTMLATLIRENRFPPKEPILEVSMDGSGESGIPLESMS
ncbi:plasma-membrane proton-efflux P-type ATPase [Nitzschia inconspicua]|uniref:Plasma-membrane proton-efflux P-type ATPase n=1 Tax=Nitzschia inconspicua TaxID=303405 RepID=A0A9K3PBK1_9STRA|nr:plasma-membrane proton-efflux P-type ATPase [Nitzschia inconspicua]